MTEKQGNTKQSNLNYIHTVISQKKKCKNKVKNKQEIQNRSNFSKCIKEKKSRTRNCATRELTLVILAVPCYIKPFLGILLIIPSHSTLAVLSQPCLIKLLAGIPSSHLLRLLKHRCMTPSLSRAPIQLEINGITLLPKAAIHTLCHPVHLDIMVGVVAG